MNKFHNFTVDVIENMIPWERDIYYELILEQLKKEAEEQKLRNMASSPHFSVEVPQFD